MLEAYLPKKFCREFVKIKGYSGQLASIMATVKGLKPCMDDWVDMDRYDDYLKACKKYGLFVRPDAVFKMVPRRLVQGKIVGSDRLITTIALGIPFKKAPRKRDYQAHVFISKKKKLLDRCFVDGWYPLIIENRLQEKPLIDNFRFGYGLGYPKCCVDYFHKYNNWFKYSYLYQSFKNTQGSFFSRFCNPFLKNATYSYIYHMPCSYNCTLTVEYGKKVREAIKEEEPDFVKAIDYHLKLPVLIFYETRIYIFDGCFKNGKIKYRRAYYTGTDQDNNVYLARLQKGDSLFVEGRTVVILKGTRPVDRIECSQSEFAPEHPFCIQFS